MDDNNDKIGFVFYSVFYYPLTCRKVSFSIHRLLTMPKIFVMGKKKKGISIFQFFRVTFSFPEHILNQPVFDYPIKDWQISF